MFKLVHFYKGMRVVLGNLSQPLSYLILGNGSLTNSRCMCEFNKPVFHQ